MATLDVLSLTVCGFEHTDDFDEAELAAAAFLARYSGRTLDAYRHDLRTFFQWAADVGLEVLEATRPTSSCTAEPSNNERWRRRRSTGASRPCVASTGSRTSTAASHRTRPSTCAGRASIRARVAGWTAPSSARSCSPPNGSTGTTRRWRYCSD